LNFCVDALRAFYSYSIAFHAAAAAAAAAVLLLTVSGLYAVPVANQNNTRLEITNQRVDEQMY
jgi:cobalamin biosynthesis protein CbiD